VKFVLRASYLSQGAWGDLFPILARLVHQNNGLFTPLQLIDLIERDVFFSCNLLCMSFAELKELPPAERRSGIGRRLEKFKT
jgi:hypothetical protein